MELIYCYAPGDEGMLQELDNHLSVVKSLYKINSWDDRKIRPGDTREKEITDHLNNADLILLLISANFLGSDDCTSITRQALKYQETGKATVIPIHLSSVDWKGARFEHLEPLPTRARPVEDWDNQGEAFTNIAQGVRRVAEKIHQKHSSSKIENPGREGEEHRDSPRAKNPGSDTEGIDDPTGEEISPLSQSQPSEEDVDRDIHLPTVDKIENQLTPPQQAIISQKLRFLVLSFSARMARIHPSCRNSKRIPKLLFSLLLLSLFCLLGIKTLGPLLEIWYNDLQPQQVLDRFCNDLQEGQYQDAYALIAPMAQKNNGGFEGIKNGWAAKKITKCTDGTIQEVANTSVYTGIITYDTQETLPDHPDKTQFWIEETQGSWKISTWGSVVQ